MADGHAGRPDVDRLIERRATEKGKLNELIAIDQAEATVAAVRRDELVAEQAAALRRVTAAKGLLTKARKDGGAEKIAAARKRVDKARAEFDRISDAVIAELGQIATARHDSVGHMFGQIRRSWDADDAVFDALRPRPATDDSATP